MSLLRGMRSNAKYVWIVVFVCFVGGFLLLDTSGLLGSSAISPSTAVATVNGRDILYTEWSQRVQVASQQQSTMMGRPLNLDEMKAVENRILDEMVLAILLEQEYKRRGITVSDAEIVRAAEFMPHPELMQADEMKTDGRFDPEKYRRLLQSPQSRQSGLLQNLEAYYRSEIPRLKLFEQITADVYISDAEMWEKWQEVHDSVQVSYVALTPDAKNDTSGISVTDAEIREYYQNNQKSFEQPGSALVSYVHIPKEITAADSAAALKRANDIRAEIAGGANFDDVAKRESIDSASAAAGGKLGKSGKGRFVETFEKAAFALRPGQLSQPVLSDNGYHIIRVDERKGDTIDVRHILVGIAQSDSASIQMDQRGDLLAQLAGGSLKPADFDSAAKRLGLPLNQALVFEGQPLMIGNRYIPSVAAFAFSGAQVGESSDLFDPPEGYYLARLDSLSEGGVPPLEDVSGLIRQRLSNKKKLQTMLPQAAALASKAAATSLEAAAATLSMAVQKSPTFTRISFVQGLGRENEAIGAAFALPVNSVSAPVVTEDAIYVMRIDRRVNADRAAWEKQRELQRTLLTQSLQQDRLQRFMVGLRSEAKVEDHRKEIAANARKVI